MLLILGSGLESSALEVFSVNVKDFGKFDLKYEIKGGSLKEISLDDFNTIIVTIQSSRNGFLTITLPRDLIDSKFYGDDPFVIIIDGKEEDYDETRTSSDRTLTIPFRMGTQEIFILGTCSIKDPCPADIEFPKPESSETIEMRINDIISTQLVQESPDGFAKVLIFSNADWTGYITDSGLDTYSFDGSDDQIYQFGCFSNPEQRGTYTISFHKTIHPRDSFFSFLDDSYRQDRAHDGYLEMLVIQNGEILDRGRTTASYGSLILRGVCQPHPASLSIIGGGCLIATAIFGSELAPQVQQLREIRDNTLLQTESGSAFMTGFNQFYYSFSPTIADWERANPVFKETVKLAIAPLLTSLSILNYVNIDSEAEMLGYGLSLILLNVGMYFVAPIIAIVKLKKFVK